MNLIGVMCCILFVGGGPTPRVTATSIGPLNRSSELN